MQIQNSCSLQPWPLRYTTVLVSFWNSACSLQLNSRRSEKKVKKDECRSKITVACSYGLQLVIFCLQLDSRRSKKSVENYECGSKTTVACSHGQCVITQSQLLFGILPVACSWSHGGLKKALKMMNLDPKQLQLLPMSFTI